MTENKKADQPVGEMRAKTWLPTGFMGPVASPIKAADRKAKNGDAPINANAPNAIASIIARNVPVAPQAEIIRPDIMPEKLAVP